MQTKKPRKLASKWDMKSGLSPFETAPTCLVIDHRDARLERPGLLTGDHLRREAEGHDGRRIVLALAAHTVDHCGCYIQVLSEGRDGAGA